MAEFILQMTSDMSTWKAMKLRQHNNIKCPENPAVRTEAKNGIATRLGKFLTILDLHCKYGIR